MQDPMDKFSLPVGGNLAGADALYRLFAKLPRLDPKKPGRELIVHYDQRFPQVEGFKLNYLYTVESMEEMNAAGNHFHQKKQEIFIPLLGEFIVELIDIKTREYQKVLISARNKREDFAFSGDYNSATERIVHNLHIRTEIAHKVTFLNNGGILLVLATSPNNDGDEFSYDLNVEL